MEDNRIVNSIHFSIIVSLINVMDHTETKNTDVILAQYFLMHLKDAENLTLEQTAADCYVSVSSVQRFVKSFHYQNFLVFRQALINDRRHQSSLIDFSSHDDFAAYLSASINHMTTDINASVTQKSLTHLAQRIYQAPHLVVAMSETGNHSVLTFQHKMIVANKMVFIITDLCPDQKVLTNLDEKDLLITSSVTGGYAVAMQDLIQPCHAYKVLITLNRADLFKQSYDEVYYLSKKVFYRPDLDTPISNIYTIYGMPYFFDLLYAAYIQILQK
jgi:DNA-binding MurR/RpiR family transcriptional regulator